MAISFNKQKGSAQKSSNNSYKYVDGDNKVRIVGDILARYVYWIKGENDKNLPLECLSFDRDAEAFTNKEKTGFVSTTLTLSAVGLMLHSVSTLKMVKLKY